MSKHLQIHRQPTLPMSKALEIAWKSIRLRLSRSLLVTSGIVLAMAFLVSILMGDAIISGMRDWIAHANESSTYAQMQAQRTQLIADLRERGPALREAMESVPKAKVPPKSSAVKAAIGADMESIGAEVDALPSPPDVVANAVVNDAGARQAFTEWLASERQLIALRQTLDAPQQLQSRLEESGVPMKPAEIASNKIQQRWLIGLALLVAFVGILNAMLMSVTERFREIGTMKCLGALDSFIIKLFLIESLFQGLVGTIIGVALGVAVSFALAMASYGSATLLNLPWVQIIWSLAASLAVGVVLTIAGALYPAWQAARMPPIEAMRADV